MRRLTCQLTYALLLWGVVSSAHAVTEFYNASLIIDCGYGTLEPRFISPEQAGEWAAGECQARLGGSVVFLYADNDGGGEYLWFSRNGGGPVSYGTANYFTNAALCSGGLFWNPETQSCQATEWVDLATYCPSMLGQTETEEALIKDPSAPASDIYDQIMPDFPKDNFGGCEVTFQSVTECYTKLDGPDAGKTFCAFNVTHTGNVYGGTAPQRTGQDTATKDPVTEYNEENIGDWVEDYNNSFPENGCITDGNGNQVCTQKEQTVTVDNMDTSVQWDGNQLTAKKIETTTTTETTTETTTTFPDGSKTVVNVISSEVINGGNITTVINSSGVTSTSNPPTSTTATTTTTQNYDTTGQLTNESTTTDVDPQYGDGPSPNGYANGDTSGIDSSIDSYKAAPAAPLEQPALPLNFTFGQACNAGDYSLNFMGFSASIDICPYIGYLQTILYWVFYLFTAVFVFLSVSHLNR